MGQIYRVVLTTDERKMLLNLINEGKANKEKLNRARILLKADCGEEGEFWKDADIADAFYINRSTVDRTRQTLVEEGLDAALNRTPPKRSRERIIKGDEEAYLIALTCGDPPAGHCRWTLRLLTSEMVRLEYSPEVSHETVRTALKKMNLSLGRKKNGV